MNGKIILFAKSGAIFIQNFLFTFGNFFADLQKVPLYAQILFALCVLFAICLVILICILHKNKKNQKKENSAIKADISEKSLKEIEKIVKNVVSENNKKNENAREFSENAEIEELEELPETRKTLPEETGLQSAFIEELEEISDENSTEESEHRGIDLESYEKHESIETGDVNYTPSNAVDSSKFEGTEPLVLGDETKFNKQSEGETKTAKDFKIFTPFDYKTNGANKLESSKIEQVEQNNEENQEKNNKNENIEISKKPAEENVAPLEELSANADKDGFMFTTFCANDNNVTDLPIEAIVLGEDGVFQISSNIPSTNVPIDEDFKKLVDSVLH